MMRCSLAFALVLAPGLTSALAQTSGTATLRGQVTDEFGGVVVGAVVTVADATGVEKTVTTDAEGNFALAGLAPGKYLVRAQAGGFAPYENAEVEIAAGRRDPLNIRLGVALERQEVIVSAESPLSIDESNRADAIVLRGADIDALPDDPDELAAALAALAGPSVGPNGGQILIDGFEGGTIPPKSSIREVRINENPLAAERDQPGFGGIQIFTKPGTDKFRGSAYTTFMDESFNSRNPFVESRAPFQFRQFGGNVSGTIIPKRASFFIDFDRSETDDNDLINAIILNDTTLQQERFISSVVTPNRSINFNPRFDYQLNTNNTLVARYSMLHVTNANIGVGQFSLESRSFDTSRTAHTLQLTETAVLNQSAINETRFQYIHNRREQNGDNSTPAINVQDAFFGGGSQVGQSFTQDKRWEVTNTTTIAKGKHSVKFGARLRGVNYTDFSENNFGGTYIFAGSSSQSAIERFQLTRQMQQQGFTPQQIRAAGGGATQLNINGGEPEVNVTQIDFGGFVQDEWKLRPNLTLGAGLRYENQTNINSNFNFAPRLFFSWSPDGGGQKPAKTVIRGGFGIFYDRINENMTLNARRFNGVDQLQFQITNPAILDLFPAIPSVEQLSGLGGTQVTRRVAEDLQAPYSYTTGLMLERQLPYKFTFFSAFITFRTRHLLRSRNINAPLPGTYTGPGTGVFPLADTNGSNPVYLFESSGNQNMKMLQFGMQKRLSAAFSIFANYTLFNVKSDTDGPFSFPANSYDLSSETGRAPFDIRHRFALGGSFGVPYLKLLLNPIIIANSGRPFNIITGRDNNGDGRFEDRPSFATNADCANPAPGIRCTPYGNFNLNPALGEEIIPRNFGEGPGFLSFNLRIS
ncbi:MAG TPA: carboxypeptidase regulatory-like domain-containing protein, partial [Pyrinomonadaceae bacterium]|nr:carboxypeptidase regulatory-like domain-containing protein [Pyrinomonadaceae bacterium]